MFSKQLHQGSRRDPDVQPEPARILLAFADPHRSPPVEVRTVRRVVVPLHVARLHMLDSSAGLLQQTVPEQVVRECSNSEGPRSPVIAHSLSISRR